MKRIIAVLAALLLTAPALAQEISYNFVQLGYQNVEIDVGPGDVDGDGFTLSGSFEIGEQFHVFGGYGSADFGSGVDLNELLLGVGFNTEVANNTDFVASLAFVEAEVDAGGFGSVDDNGYQASIGLRSMVAPQFELAGSINYVDFGDSDDTSLDAAGWYYFNDNVAGGVGVSFGDDITSYGLAVRVFFGR